jgi:hypothetical protein
MRRLLAVVLLAGCVPLSYAFTPSTQAPIKAKPSNCEFKVFLSNPAEGYEEIGTLQHYNGTPPKDTEKFKKAVAEQVCQVGGDAVIATSDEKGQLMKGSIIRWSSTAQPVKPISDVPSVQQSDEELPKK